MFDKLILTGVGIAIVGFILVISNNFIYLYWALMSYFRIWTYLILKTKKGNIYPELLEWLVKPNNNIDSSQDDVNGWLLVFQNLLKIKQNTTCIRLCWI